MNNRLAFDTQGEQEIACFSKNWTTHEHSLKGHEE